VSEIEQELKLLHWHKLANEASLKAAILRTRRIRARDRSQAALMQQRQRERAARLKQVSRDLGIGREKPNKSRGGGRVRLYVFEVGIRKEKILFCGERVHPLYHRFLMFRIVAGCDGGADEAT
jgi:hypothetical protein